MKQIITLIGSFLLLFSTGLYAQSSFSIEHDTVYASPEVNMSTTIEDGVTATTGTVTISWKVISSNFPTDWVPAYSICDNNLCYIGSGLWTPSGGTIATKTSLPYNTSLGDFHMVIDFGSATSTGCYYMTVRMANQSVPTDTAYETYMICNSTTGVPAITQSDDIVLYPNPAHDEINVVYDPSFDVRNITVYNIIGKVMAVYKVSNSNSANLNLENIPSGIYFLRLVNSHGDVAVTRKFTKQ